MKESISIGCSRAFDKVMNYRTTLRDMEILLDDLRRVAQKQE